MRIRDCSSDVCSADLVRLVVNDARQADIAAALVDPGVKILVQPLGDIWLRDTGPIIAGTGAARRARNFLFNWWGEKFVMPGDREVGAALAAGPGLPVDDQAWIIEGGGSDVDGAGLCVPETGSATVCTHATNA